MVPGDLLQRRSVWLGIQGGTCSGKSTLARQVADRFSSDDAIVINLDQFYFPFDLSAVFEDPTAHNYDDPASVDWELVRDVVTALRNGVPTNVPTIDYTSGARIAPRYVRPTKYIIVEGLWPFFSSFLREIFDLRVFIDVPADVRLVRRLTRDIGPGTRGWPISGALAYYTRCARPMHERFVEPGKVFAEIIVNGEDNCEAITQVVASALVRRLGV